MNGSAIITDHRTLRGMEIQGFIIRNGSPKSRERHWTGNIARVCHVKPGPKLKNWYDVFKFRGEEYRIQYFDGCFHPFVTRLSQRMPSFV